MDWTPAPRRPTAIRREQNLALVSAVVSGGVIAAGLILLLVARVNPETASGVRAAATDIVAPLWSVVRAPIDGAGKVAGDFGDYFGAVSRADQLEAELDKANARLRAARNGQRELQQLKRLMAVREPTRTVLATTRIAAATSGSVARTAMLAVGSGDGITRDMPVIGTDGLVGRTLEVGRQSARVLLLTDTLSRVPVIVERTGQAGLAVGRNLPTLLLTDRIGPELALVAGDRIVTSGDGGVYPPGVPVVGPRTSQLLRRSEAPRPTSLTDITLATCSLILTRPTPVAVASAAVARPAGSTSPDARAPLATVISS